MSDAHAGPLIRPEEVPDRTAIADVVTRAFDSAAHGLLVDGLRESAAFVPPWSLVAIVDGQVVGHVMVTYATLRDVSSDHRVASLSPLSVDPAFQRRGIGSALVRAVVPRVESAGEPLIVLEGSPSYYARFGFEYSVPFGIRIELPDWAPPEAAQLLRLALYDPALRGDLVYPPAFDVVSDNH